MAKFRSTVSREVDGERLDNALVKCGVPLSKRKIRAAIEVGGVYVNGRRQRMAGKLVSAGDKLEVEYFEDQLRQASHQAKTLGIDEGRVLHLDDEIIVINKPPGMPAQATRSQALFHVEAAVKNYLKQIQAPKQKVVLVHRLDKETSGVMVVARTTAAATKWTDAFRERKVKKVYAALSLGRSAETEFTEQRKLSEINKFGRVEISEDGKEAFTRFVQKPLKTILPVSQWQCFPTTGRTHQIRVHLAACGLPILGDKLYSPQNANDSRLRALPEAVTALLTQHHFLHAEALAFAGQTFSAPFPPLWAEMLRILDGTAP
jgi:23S rRNA pseudouridine1911/1915/1917 synthase